MFIVVVFGVFFVSVVFSFGIFIVFLGIKIIEIIIFKEGEVEVKFVVIDVIIFVLVVV